MSDQLSIPPADRDKEKRIPLSRDQNGDEKPFNYFREHQGVLYAFHIPYGGQ